MPAKRTIKRTAKRTSRRRGKRTERVRQGPCPNTGYKWIPANSTTFVFLDNEALYCEKGNCKGEHTRYRWKVINNNDEGGYLKVYKRGYYRISSSSRTGSVRLYKQQFSCSKCKYVDTGTSTTESIDRYKNEEPC